MRRSLNTILGFVISVAVTVASTSGHCFDLFISKNSDVEKGNKALKEGKFNDALEYFDAAARTLPNRAEVHLNRGLALMQMKDDQLDKAMQALTLAADAGAPKAIQARAHSNLGNAFFKREDYEKAIEHYKSSLMKSPGNNDVAWNLEVAKQKQREKEKQQKENQDKQDQQNKDQDKQDQQNQDQDKQDQQNKDQDKQDQQNKDQDKQDQQNQDQDKQDQQNQDKQDKQDKQQQQKKEEQKQQQQRPMTKQEVQQMLDSLENNKDSLTKQKAKQRAGMRPVGTRKDW